ncbi:MAG: ChaN family lipoprotein [Acidobacteriota bacterium]
MVPPASPRQLSAWLRRRQRTLLQLLKREERARAGSLPVHLHAYHRRFLNEFRTSAPLPCSMRELENAVTSADLVFSADYHAHPRPEQTHLRWLRLLERSSGAPALALEMVSARHQRDLNALASGQLDAHSFRSRIGFDADWGFAWPPYSRLLREAIRRHCRLIALDHPGRSANVSVRVRDEHAGELLARELARCPRRAVLVVTGEMHLAAPHLPLSTLRALRRRGLRRRLVTIFHGSEGLYFSASKRPLPEPAALKLAQDRFCLLHAAPWVRLLAHLRWLEDSEHDWLAGPEEKVVRWTARTLALLAGVHPRAGEPAPEEEPRARPRAAGNRIAWRAVARAQSCTTTRRWLRPGTQRLWFTLARCLIDPPLAGGGALSKRTILWPGLALYERLMSASIDRARVRAALRGEVDLRRAFPPIHNQRAAARS